MVKNRPTHKPSATGIMILALVLLGGVTIASGCREGAEQGSTATQSQDPIAAGEASYRTYCVSCHGVDGKGAGPVAEVLTTPMNDLTRLRERNDGAFPVDVVYGSIDGRVEVKAHGTREMPVWGNIWSDSEGKPIREELVEQRINALVEYIRSIQVESS